MKIKKFSTLKRIAANYWFNLSEEALTKLLDSETGVEDTKFVQDLQRAMERKTQIDSAEYYQFLSEILKVDGRKYNLTPSKMKQNMEDISFLMKQENISFLEEVKKLYYKVSKYHFQATLDLLLKYGVQLEQFSEVQRFI